MSARLRRRHARLCRFCLLALLTPLAHSPGQAGPLCPGLPADAPAQALVDAAVSRLSRPPIAPQTAQEAADCLEAAFAAGDPGAAAARGRLALSGLTGPPDPTLAAHWFQQAAAAGSPQGHLELGLALAAGAGVPKEPYWAAWRLGRALTLPGLTAQEKKLAEKTAKDVAAGLSPAERAAVAANLAGKAAP